MSVIPESQRRVVQHRAGERCEYCRLPDGVDLYPPHVDHVIAQKHGGASEPDNLAWSCFECNLAKGTDIASYDLDAGALTPFFNPRTQQWDDHFALQGALIVGKTAVGCVTVRLLKMNRPQRVVLRERLINAGQW